MKTSYIFSAACSLFISASSVLAQGGAPGQMPGMDLTLIKLFGGHKAFSAKADMAITGKSGPGDMTMAVDLAMLDGKMRTEVDLSQMKSKALPPEAMAQMKQMGMDRAVNILLPAQKKMLIIFPNMKAYTSMTLPDKSAGSLTNSADLVKTELGKETIDGHPCVKNKVIVADDAGQQHEFTVWNATDLKDFPLQFETVEKGSTIHVKYHDVQFTKPDAKSFEPSAGYKSYADVQEMMMDVMQKMMPQGVPRPGAAQ